MKKKLFTLRRLKKYQKFKVSTELLSSIQVPKTNGLKVTDLNEYEESKSFRSLEQEEEISFYQISYIKYSL